MAGEREIFLSLLWHMHQPLYKSAATGDYLLPWVRLHATKGYLDIASKMLEFPEAAQTLNIVPSLILQIKDYLTGGVTDRFKTLTLKPANELTADDKKFILKYFFSINWDNCIKPIPRYWTLVRKRGVSIQHTEMDLVLGRFTEDDFRDLQVLFNLAWLGFTARKEDIAQDLLKKGTCYSENDKTDLVKFQDSCLEKLLDLWRRVARETAVEISTTPFYHPILPLVANTRNASAILPEEKIKKINFAFPQDALEQIHRGISYASVELGVQPHGMWPSEGSVCPEIIELFAKEGIRWIATDRAVLEMSHVRQDGKPVTHFEPYNLQSPAGDVAIFFRDTRLSDAIGFEYHKRPGNEAALEFLEGVKRSVSGFHIDRPPIVSVILDGENPWEYYKDGGEGFLTTLFETISNRSSEVVGTTRSGYLDNFGVGRYIDNIHSGSWIRHNFSIWINDPEKDRAWELLAKARRYVEDYFRKTKTDKTELKSEVFEHIYAAEGSDWFWWYGEPFHTDFDPVFDLLFRQQLIHIYELLGKSVPGELKQPLIGKALIVVDKEPVDVVSPNIDGRVTNYFEWVDAGLYKPKISGTVMASDSTPLFQAIQWGFDGFNLFIRIDLSSKTLIDNGLTLVIRFYSPNHVVVSLPLDRSCDGYNFNKFINEQLAEFKRKQPAAIDDIVELGIPFEELGADKGDLISFAVYLAQDAEYIERCPFDGTITFGCPRRDYKAQMWKV